MCKCCVSVAVLLTACCTNLAQTACVATPPSAGATSPTSLSLLVQQMKSTDVDQWNNPGSKDNPSRKQILASLAKLSDPELEQVVDQSSGGGQVVPSTCALTEIERRKGTYWEKALTARLPATYPALSPPKPCAVSLTSARSLPSGASRASLIPL